MKRISVILLTIVCIVCTLSLIQVCQAQTDKVLKLRPAWIGSHYSLENTYLDDITVPGKFEDLNLLESKASNIAKERRKLAVGDNKAQVKASPIGGVYYSKKEGAAHFLFQTGETPTESHKTWEKIQAVNRYPFSARVFVPGYAQIYKGSYGKGVGFITGEVLFIGGIVTTEFMRVNYSQKVSQTHSSKMKEYYARNSRICAITRNACIGGAVALYIWNIIDGAVAPGREYLRLNGKQLSFIPYTSHDNYGLVMNFKF